MLGRYKEILIATLPQVTVLQRRRAAGAHPQGALQAHGKLPAAAQRHGLHVVMTTTTYPAGLPTFILPSSGFPIMCSSEKRTKQRGPPTRHTSVYHTQHTHNIYTHTPTTTRTSRRFM